MSKRLIILLFISLIFFGCDPHKDQPTEKIPQNKPVRTAGAFQQPQEAITTETATEALALWRETAAAHPTLLLLSKNPQLQPIPAAVKARALALARTGSTDELQRTSLVTNPDPVILPNMALSAALDAGFFSKVVWVLPASAGTEIPLGTFLQKLLELGDITQPEADSFQATEKTFTGKIRGVPFEVTLKSAIPAIKTPVVLHFDIGFLAADYQNEIRTPLYRHTFDTIKLLRSLNLQTAAISISRSNLTGEVSLKTRFLGTLIKDLAENPALLDAPLSVNAERRNEALYLGNFFKKDEVLALNREMTESDPQDAAAYYDLYQTLRQFKETAEIFASLDQAVKLDPAYAAEYFELAELAIEKNQPRDALRMLEKGLLAFPDNSSIKLGMIELLIATGQTAKARAMLANLSRLKWSPAYHPDIDVRLTQLSNWADEQDKTHEQAKKMEQGDN